MDDNKLNALNERTLKIAETIRDALDEAPALCGPNEQIGHILITLIREANGDQTGSCASDINSLEVIAKALRKAADDLVLNVMLENPRAS